MLRIVRVTAACIALGVALPVGAEPSASAGTDPSAVANVAVPRADTQPPPSQPAPAQPAPAQPAPPAERRGLEDDRPGWAQPQPDNESLLGALLRMALVLGLVLALIYLTLNLGLRKLMQVTPGRHALVKVHERVSLEPKRSVYLVEAAGEYLLLGVGEHDVNLLAKLERDSARQAIEQKVERIAQAPRPFWDRLAVKPNERKQPPGGSKT